MNVARDLSIHLTTYPALFINSCLLGRRSVNASSRAAKRSVVISIIKLYRQQETAASLHSGDDVTENFMD